MAKIEWGVSEKIESPFQKRCAKKIEWGILPFFIRYSKESPPSYCAKKLSYAKMSHIIEPIITVIEETKEDIERKKATAYFVNMKMIGGSTGLVFAIKKNNTNITRILLEHGADPNLEAVEKTTPLHYAVVLWRKRMRK